MSSIQNEEVMEVRHWTDSLFSFATTRHSAFRFRSGQFTMLGLDGPERPVLRAYSIASAPYEDRLECKLQHDVDGPDATICGIGCRFTAKPQRSGNRGTHSRRHTRLPVSAFATANLRRAAAEGYRMAAMASPVSRRSALSSPCGQPRNS